MKTWCIVVEEMGMRFDFAEFRNKKDAEKASKYMKDEYKIETKVVEQKVFESFEEFADFDEKMKGDENE